MRVTVRHLPKPGGGVRPIAIPDAATRRVLVARLHEAYTRVAPEKIPHAHGCIPGRSPTTGATAHARRRWTVSADIRRFFDAVRVEQVYAGLADVSQDALWAAQWAADVCVEGAPRQGLPTSPWAANCAAILLDRMIVQALHTFASESVYTRYVDDLTVSTDNREAVSRIRDALTEAVAAMGWEIHPKKWALQDARAGRRVICGVAIDADGTPHATRTARRRLRAAEHRMRTASDPDVIQRAERRVHGLREWCAQRAPIDTILTQIIPRDDRRSKVRAVLDADLRGASDKGRLRLRATVTAWSDHASHVWRAQQRVHDICRDAYSRAEQDRWGFALGVQFGSSWASWLAHATTALDVHELCDWLPVRHMPGLGARLLSWWRSGLGNTRLIDYMQVAKNWHHIPAHVRESGTLAEIKRACANGPGYAGLDEVYQVCAQKEGYTGSAVRRIVLKMQHKLRKHARRGYDAIPRFSFDIDAYRIEVLAREDSRALWAGTLTDCCQHPGGAAESSAWHGATHEEGAVLLIQHASAASTDVLAQSWLWRRDDVVVIDNVEVAKHARMTDEKWIALYQAAAQRIVGRLKIQTVHVGLRGSPIGFSKLQRVVSLKPPPNTYSDADLQVLLYGCNITQSD